VKTVLSPVKWIALPEPKSQFNEGIIEIERIEDETWGEVLEIKRHADDDDPWQISKAEWPAIRTAINKAMKHCQYFEQP